LLYNRWRGGRRRRGRLGSLLCALSYFALGGCQQALRVGFASARGRARSGADRLNLGLDLGVRPRGVGRCRGDTLAGPLDQRRSCVVRQVATQPLILLDSLEHTLLALVLAHRRSFLHAGISIPPEYVKRTKTISAAGQHESLTFVLPLALNCTNETKIQAQFVSFVQFDAA
jgi:hypothetical protein